MDSPPATAIEAACHRLAIRYADAVDRKAFDEAVALFAPDGVLGVPAGLDAESVDHAGHDEIGRALSRVRFAKATLHDITGHVLDPVPDAAATTATGRTWCRAHHVFADGDGQVQNLLWTLRYDDAYALVDGQWRFARRAMSVLWEELREVARVPGDGQEDA